MLSGRRSISKLGLWLEAETVSTGSALVAQDELHAAYALACTKADQPIVTKQMFGRALKLLRPELREAQRTIGGRKRWVYLGIEMKNGLGESPGKSEATPADPRIRSLESLDQEDFSWW